MAKKPGIKRVTRSVVKKTNPARRGTAAKPPASHPVAKQLAAKNVKPAKHLRKMVDRAEPVLKPVDAKPPKIVAGKPTRQEPIAIKSSGKKRSAKSSEPDQVVVVAKPAPAPPTSEKPNKNKAGLTDKDLAYYRELLLAKRREILGDMSSMEREALSESSSDLSNLPVHMADQGTDAYEQEFTLGLVENNRSLLKDINDALAKIQDGTYGTCEGTGKPISKARLEAIPWVRYGLEHAQALEKKQGHYRR